MLQPTYLPLLTFHNALHILSAAQKVCRLPIPRDITSTTNCHLPASFAVHRSHDPTHASFVSPSLPSTIFHLSSNQSTQSPTPNRIPSGHRSIIQPTHPSCLSHLHIFRPSMQTTTTQSQTQERLVPIPKHPCIHPIENDRIVARRHGRALYCCIHAACS